MGKARACQLSAPSRRLAAPYAGKPLRAIVSIMFAKTIQLAERGVDVGRDPDALEFFMNDRRGEDAVFVEEIA